MTEKDYQIITEEKQFIKVFAKMEVNYCPVTTNCLKLFAPIFTIYKPSANPFKGIIG